MDPATAALLVGDEGRAALALAAQHSDLGSADTGVRMRRQLSPELAAAALTQESLRRKARTKFGDAAPGLFYTVDGLQQATRPNVAADRAARLVAAGVTRVVDLGCGLGSDALAFAAAGLEVTAVESDPATAILAQANADQLAAPDRLIRVITGTAEDLAPRLLADPGTAVFCDPARRDDRGRVWRVDQFSPGWDLVIGLLDGARVACVKLGPALPHALIPDGVEAGWMSDRQSGGRGDVVEVGLWAGPGVPGGTRAATLLPSGDRLSRQGPGPTAAVGPIGAYLHEPDGAAIRAGLVGSVAELTGTVMIAPQIAYLTSDTLPDTPTDSAPYSPWLTSFAVVEVLPYTEKVLRRWLSDHQVGRLEIKKRGVDVDPALLRKRLKPSGQRELTMLVTRTPDGTRAVMAERMPPPQAEPASGGSAPG